MRQAVDDEVVAARLAQVEGLDRDPLDGEADDVVADRQRQVELADELLVADRPAQVGAQRQTDPAGDVSHRVSPSRVVEHSYS